MTPERQRVASRCGGVLGAFMALCLFVRPVDALAAEQGEAQAPHPAVSCQENALPKSIDAARSALDQDPTQLDARLKLADALIDQGCYKDAVPVLEAGVAGHPRSSELQSRLRAARSMLSEEHFFEGLGNAQEAAKLQHDLLRCTKLGDLGACDEALKSRPGDPQLTVAKADALLQAGHLAEALLVYRRAAEMLPGDSGVKAKLASAEAQRQVLVSRCEGGAGAQAVDACDAALLHGSSDEFALLKRKGILLQSMGRPAPALDALIAANLLKQDDKSVALAIVALTDSTDRKDALALAARGSALLTLDRPTDALAALRQAQSLAPALPGLKPQLALAEKAARAEPKRAAAAVVAKTTSASSKPSITAGVTAPVATGRGVAAHEPARVAAAETQSYSNDATSGRTN